jgi:hypothetical protein
LPKIKAATEATIAKLDADIITQKAEAEKANKLIPEYQAKIAVIDAELTKLKADTANATKNKLTISKYTTAIRNYEAAIKAYETVGKQTDRSEKLKGQAQTQYDSSKMDVETTLSMAKIICTKGF